MFVAASFNNLMRRRSGSNFEEIVAREFNVLSKVEQNEVNSLFKKTEQRNGGISFYDFINILRSRCKVLW